MDIWEEIEWESFWTYRDAEANFDLYKKLLFKKSQLLWDSFNISFFISTSWENYPNWV